MSVAVKSLPETTQQDPRQRLARASVLGTAYVISAIIAVFYAIPRLWQEFVSPTLTQSVSAYIDVALMILAMLGAAAALVVFPARPASLWARIFAIFVFLILAVMVVREGI